MINLLILSILKRGLNRQVIHARITLTISIFVVAGISDEKAQKQSQMIDNNAFGRRLLFDLQFVGVA